MKRVRCLDPVQSGGMLEYGKEYEVEEEFECGVDGRQYKLKGIDTTGIFWYAHRFEVIGENKEEKPVTPTPTMPASIVVPTETFDYDAYNRSPVFKVK